MLQEVGVREDLAEPLAALSLAVAAVHGADHLLPESADSRMDQQAGAEAASETTDREPGRGSRGRSRSKNDPHQVEAPGVKARATQLLAAVEAISTTAAQVESVLVTATAELTQMTGRLLLAEKGAHSPEELTSDQRDRWRARAKRVTRHEIEAVTGWGAGESMDLVALANTPAAITGPVAHALSTGHAPWRLVRRYYRACSGLDHEDAAAIANGLFGNDPKAAVTERITSDGEWVGGPWRHREFYRALDREVAKVNSRDPQAAREAQARALAASDTRVSISSDGTAAVTTVCSPTQAAAIAERVERAARAARHAGDPRPLHQLRAAVAASLLLHGTLPLSDRPADPELVTTQDSAQLTKIMHALPTANLNVIVPLGTLIGADRNALTTQPPHPDDSGRPPPASPEADEESEVGVGEVIGPYPLFLYPGQVRELALTPGSTLHRLLTDPATGRCVERSTTAYRFDAAMKAQIVAADVFCRAPGCLTPGQWAQIDHVEEYGSDGGYTSEANGQLLHTGHHDQKTQGAWDATINRSREVTWRTLLDRIIRTKAHDHNQYTKLLSQATIRIEHTRPEDRSATIDQEICQALTYRRPGKPLEGPDDVLDLDYDYRGWDRVRLPHVTSSGPCPQDPGAADDGSPTSSDSRSRDGDPDTDTTGWKADPDEPPPF